MRTRARYAILNYIMSCCIHKKVGDDTLPVIDKEDAFSVGMYLRPQVGDLVCLQSVIDADRWYLSWCVEANVSGDIYSSKYLLESIEDGSLCWWSNVGFSIMDRAVVEKNKHWKYTDKQFELADKWNKVCSKNKQSFFLYGGGLEFDGDCAIFSIRKSNYSPEYSRTFYKYKFENWKKIKVSDMQRFWDDTVKLLAKGEQ